MPPPEITQKDSVDIRTPDMGESISQATVVRWLKTPGEGVRGGEALVEVETDKIMLEVSAPCDGVLEDTLSAVGGVVHPGDLLGHVRVTNATAVTEGGLPTDSKTTPPESASLESADLETTLPEPSLSSAPTPGVQPSRAEERVPLSALRQRIAQRLKEAQNTAAIVWTMNEIDMSAILGVREREGEAFHQKYGIKLGLMSFFVRACVGALEEIPVLNGTLEGPTFVYRHYCHMGVAVATDQGLMVPVVRHAETLDFPSIEKEIARLAAKARAGKMTLEDLEGGTFTLSNGGVYGSLLSTPILNAPQTGLLGLHAIQKRPVVIHDTLEIRPMMYVTLAYDHRVVDGRQAVTFLGRIKTQLEAPERMLLGM